MDAVCDFLTKIIKNDYLLITIAAAFPLVELKGSILLGIAKGMSPFWVFCLSFIGSTLIAPIILLFLRPLINLIKKIAPIKKFAMSVESKLQEKALRFKRKNDKTNGNNGIILSLLLFVAFPAPMTGVWSGAAIAVFLNINYINALFVIIIGNLISGIIVFAVALFFQPYSDIIFIAFLIIIAAVLLSSICFSLIRKMFVRKNKLKKT